MVCGLLYCPANSLIAENYEGFDSVKDRTYRHWWRMWGEPGMTWIMICLIVWTLVIIYYIIWDLVNYMENIKCNVFFVIIA